MMYLHVGLPKTGTTFMQAEVFPKWTGIEYLTTGNIEHFLRLDRQRSALVSREGLLGSHNYTTWSVRAARMKRLSDIFPKAKILVSFRRHAPYIVSNYRQYLQRGGTLEFGDYFDLDGDGGLLKRDDLMFRKDIESIEAAFGRKPFVFCQEEIRKSLPRLLLDLQAFIGGQAPDPDQLQTSSHNRSVGYYPAKMLRRLNLLARSPVNPSGRVELYSHRLVRLHLDPRSICQYGLWFLPDRPFITEELSAQIDDHYAADWDYVQARLRSRLDDGAGAASRSAEHAAQ